MQRGSAYWTYDATVDAWYVGLNERASPPYRTQIEVQALLDLDDEGRLAGIEIIGRPGGEPIALPPIVAGTPPK